MEGPGEVSIRLEQPQEQSLRVGMTDANGAERCATDPFHDSSIEQSIPDRIQYGRVGVQAKAADRQQSRQRFFTARIPQLRAGPAMSVVRQPGHEGFMAMVIPHPGMDQLHAGVLNATALPWTDPEQSLGLGEAPAILTEGVVMQLGGHRKFEPQSCQEGRKTGVGMGQPDLGAL